MPANSDKPHLWKQDALDSIERLTRQKQVDASKSALERNQMGQFSTPYALACDIATYTMTLVAREQPCSVLEPASGSGVFVSAMLAHENLPPESHFTCVEIDPQYAAICRELYSDRQAQTVTEDFFQYLDSEANRFDVKDVMREGVTAGPAQGTPLEELFHVTRGLATGCNSFFVLDEQTVRDKGLESECLVPILPGPRYLKEEIVEADTQGFPLIKRRQFLLSVSLPPEEVKERFPNTFRYLEEGEAMGIHTGYICRSRKQWYFQEKRPAPLYLATYMRRGRPGSCPIRFILNRSIAVVANVFLCLYPRPSLLRLLQGHPERQEEVLAMLNAIPQAGLRDAGRCYGGGLQKVEPKELRSVRLSELPAWFPSPRLEQRDFLSLLSSAVADEHRVRAAEG